MGEIEEAIGKMVKDLTKLSTLKEMVSRTTLANIAAFILVVGGMGYFMWTENSEVVKDLALLGTGWLLKEIKNQL